MADLNVGGWILKAHSSSVSGEYTKDLLGDLTFKEATKQVISLGYHAHKAQE